MRLVTAQPPTAETFDHRVLWVDALAGWVGPIGDLDRRRASWLFDALAVLPHTGNSTVAVDGSAISFCDDEGLRVSVCAQTLATTRACRIRLVNPTPHLPLIPKAAGASEPIEGDLPPTAAAVERLVELALLPWGHLVPPWSGGHRSSLKRGARGR